MNSLVFNGRSRPNQLTLARDHRPSRESILAETQRARQKREEERQRQHAAQRLQRGVRTWQSEQTLVGRCLAKLDETAAGLGGGLECTPWPPAPSPTSVSPVPGTVQDPAGRASVTPAELETAVFCFRYVRDHAGQIPRAYLVAAWSLLHPEMPSNPAYERAMCEQHVVDHYMGVLVKCVQRFLASLTAATATTTAGLASPAAMDVLKKLSTQTLTFLTESFVRDLFAMTKAAARATRTTTATVSQPSPSPSDAQEAGVFAPCQPASRLYTTEDVVQLLGVLGEVAESSPSPVRWSVGGTVLQCVADAGDSDGVTAEARRALLRPFRGLLERGMADLFPTPPPLTELSGTLTTATTTRTMVPNEEEDETTARDEESDARRTCTTAWSTAIWGCLTNAAWSQDHMPLTTDGLLALLSLPEAEAVGADTPAAFCAASCTALFTVTTAYVVVPPRTNEDGTGSGGSGNTNGANPPTATATPPAPRYSPSGALEVLGRLTRLLPCLTSEGSDTTVPPHLPEAVRQRWLLAVSGLTEQLCTSEAFMTRVLFDLHHTRTAATAAEQDKGGTRYRYLVSHLFSREGGLQLLADYGNRAQEATGKGVEGKAANEEEATAAAAAAAPPSPTATAPTADVSAMLVSLELCSSIFAWPLYNFSMSEESSHRLETAAVFAKLARSSALLRQLWCLYRDRTPSLYKVLVQSPASLNMRLDMAERKATPGVAVAATLPGVDPPAAVLDALPRHVRVIRHLFYDPSPALSVLFFALLSYYVDVTDFKQDLERGTVLRLHECTALVLALKDIVHRAHLSGVVPGYSGEAVAHLAVSLLAKLHAVDEATPFVRSIAVWISVTDPTNLRPLGTLTPERWDELSTEYRGELSTAAAELTQRRRRRIRSRSRKGGAEDDADGEAEAADDGDDGPRAEKGAGRRTSTKRRRSAQKVKNEESVTAPETVVDPLAAGATSLSSAPCLPGEDPLFARSCFWHADVRVFRLLLHAPFMVPFAERGVLLTTLLLNTPQGRTFDTGGFVVRRGSAFMDTYERFRDQPDSASMFEVRFRDASGLIEPGYGQGVYRELMGEVCKEGFSAEHGLFRQTAAGDLYPNPFSFEATNDPDHLREIQFLGTMAGRAIRDGILQDVPFAHHFRNALLGRTNSINNLREYDAQLYEHLLALLKMSEAEIDSLELTFTYTVNALGVTREVELIRDGANVRVSRQNCLHYIQLVANFKLNREAGQQTRAFQQGLEYIVHPNWLRLFDTAELNNLLCGEPGKMDVADWRKHTVYHAPEQANDPTVRIFWGVVESLNAKQQSQLLQFSTAMKHPPLFGFRFLSPPFKIQLLPNEPEDRLPSAATCFSTLKLPPYKTFEMARAKIVAAIEETNSFGFS